MEHLRNEEEVGFLRHEAYFVMNAVRRATQALNDANKEYGEAVASSGGDWAFDDPASQVAAMEAHLKEKDLQKMLKLSHLIKDRGEVPYPDADEQIATYGSRVHTVEDDGYAGTFDLATHSIPGIPSEDDVTVVTSNAPMAKNLYGARAGETISWTAPNGKEFRATVTKVDQLAVKTYFEKVIGSTE